MTIESPNRALGKSERAAGLVAPGGGDVKFAPHAPALTTPASWYHVAWSDEIAVGDVKPLSYFGEELVCYRDETGCIHVADAHCPHMGAHLACGGTVQGEDIICPFHGWRWDADGRNVDIPYSDRPRRQKRLRQWAAKEVSGLVFVWFHPEGSPPTWDVPMPEVTPAADYFPAFPHGAKCERRRMHPQYLVENTVDLAHLTYVHEWQGASKLERYAADDHRFDVVLRGTLATRHGEIGVLDCIDIHGMGVVLAQQSYGWDGEAPGLDDPRESVVVMAITPVDDVYSDIRVSAFVHRSLSSEEERPAGRAKGAITGAFREVYEHDTPIWENLVYVQNPPLTREEGKPVATIRRWTTQFYPDRAESATS
jgi:phenylpropionate dioxygenase-like ring-hydroxylating dioxygenase large terminal subunit